MFSSPYDLFEIAKHSYHVHLKFLQTSSVYYQYCQKYKELIDDHFQKVTVLNDRIEYRIEGKLHRDDDLPAIIYYNGTRAWYKYGKLHRDGDLPAIIYNDGTHKWYKRGQLHRDGDLPAIINSNGTLEWCKYGQSHRDNDLPAIVRAGGTYEWYIHGTLIKTGYTNWWSKRMIINMVTTNTTNTVAANTPWYKTTTLKRASWL